MRSCCMCGSKEVQFHHNIEYAGRQSDDPKSIMPLCKPHHDMISDPLIREEVDWLMFIHKKLDPSDYPRSGLAQRKKYLVKKYGY